ncbi:DUF1330 domain-containing protein [Halomonas sp. AOP27-A1-41]|uniref:DUF1330 domain-containing protein n=1 Tax=Halomonas sp. AOP27-A1-41 TaxID=3457707 RepID=UPI0040340C3E
MESAVILRFSDMTAARAWSQSGTYQEARKSSLLLHHFRQGGLIGHSSLEAKIRETIRPVFNSPAVTVVILFKAWFHARCHNSL